MRERGTVHYGSTVISYEIVRSRRRKKTVEITLDGSAGVIVAAPADAPVSDVEAIVRKRAPWILRKASNSLLQASPRRFVSGETLPYLGRRVRMVVRDAMVDHPAIRLRHWQFDIAVPGRLCGEERREAIRKAVENWYRERAKNRLDAAIARWGPLVGCEPASVLIRNQKSRWGSCAPDGTLRFNWRTVMAEPALIDYIVVHELVHLEVKNHSPEFWRRVAVAIPDYQQRRKKLREIGPYLML